MFRLPTHLESLIPPPNDQVPQPRPWRGVFTIPGAHQGTPTQELYVTAAETEGDSSQAEKWPSRFHVHVIGQRGVLQQIYDWTKRNTPPMCIFMPDRLPQQASSQANHAQFEAFAQHLLQNQLIAVASWGGSSTLRGAGIILYPTATARAFLVGAIFLETRFPDFVVALSPGPSRSLTSPRQLVPLGHNPDEGAPPNIASSLRYTQSGARSHG
ncbi:hypothetical protein CERSUDRAFT_116070 [Gelatoporia subvermispora B]|uniref:Uncharacterized protein n=1 Tax=Ceriporiopsis subvermispora (strain B) TaxID=914234 RepID=M2R934_CERS8|nr:hypothetical protein CERSUDRAFT_116070 [Gelatoporia subvermispora B]